MPTYASRMAYVEAVGLEPIDPSKMDKRTALLWILLSQAAFQQTYRAIYTPLDVDTGQLPGAKPNWKQKLITQGNGKVAVWTSPNLWLATMQFYTQRICGHKSPNLPGPALPVPDTACIDIIEKLPTLMVDYSVVIGYKYAGTERPPDRPLEAQLKDWENGVMLARVQLPNDNVPEEKLEEYEQKWGVKLPRGWYWVAYEASYLLLPGALATANFAVLAVTVKDACKKYLFGLVKKCPKMDEVLRQTVAAMSKELTPLGFVIDTTTAYTYNGMELKGPYIVKAGSDTYTVVLPVRRTGSLAIPVALIVYAVIIALALIVAYAIAVEIEKVQAVYAVAELKRSEAYEQYVNFVTSVCKDPHSPICQKALENITPVANASKPSGPSSGIATTAEKIGIGIAVVIGAYAVAKAIENWRLSKE